jgi:type II secretory pathway predicted ATPase ExeA
MTTEPWPLVPTDHTVATARAVRGLLRHNAMGCVYGEAGLGKTVSVADAVTARRRGDRLLRTCTERFPSGWTRNEIGEQLLATITGDPIQTNLKLDRLSLKLIGELSHGGQWLLVIDEAQNLTKVAMDFFRYLHDDKSTRFALLFVGGNGCYQTLSKEPMLRSRIFWWVEFRPLPPAEVPALVRGLHPVYHDASDELLTEINDLACHGQWRAWAHFTTAVLDLLASTGRPGIDDEIIGNVLYQLTGAREDAR